MFKDLFFERKFFEAKEGDIQRLLVTTKDGNQKAIKPADYLTLNSYLTNPDVKIVKVQYAKGDRQGVDLGKSVTYTRKNDKVWIRKDSKNRTQNVIAKLEHGNPVIQNV